MKQLTHKSIKKPMSKQRGLTLISWIIILVFLLFQIVIGMNVIPVYITDSSITKIMRELPHDVKARGLSPRELKIMLAKRLSINSIYTVTAKHISVKKGRGVNIVKIQYEPRGKLIGNLEYIVKFEHEAKVHAQ